MDVKSLVAGILLAFGVSNVLQLAGIAFAMPRDLVTVMGIDIGTLVVAILALGIAFFLVKGKK
jgi:hypothetical protein